MENIINNPIKIFVPVPTDTPIPMELKEIRDEDRNAGSILQSTWNL